MPKFFIQEYNKQKVINPFFSYFGSRWKISKFYPPPKYDLIIEPFAGSAGYSTFFAAKIKKAILFDKYSIIIEVWKFLIEAANNPKKFEEFKRLPVGPFTKNNPIPKDLEPGAKWLIGFWETQSQTSPSPYQYSKNRGGMWSEIKRNKLADQLGFIKNWEAHLNSYEDLPNCEATWHIDPPFQKGGTRYIHNEIAYDKLAEWCKSRQGQVIVCEQSPADWLPFKEVGCAKNASNEKFTEMIWNN